MNKSYECDCGQITKKLYQTDYNEWVCRKCFDESERIEGERIMSEEWDERDREDDRQERGW